MLGNPQSARRGNIIAAVGMGWGIVATILFYEHNGHRISNVLLIMVAMIIGSIFGWVSAKRVKMTDMPQMVSLFNGMGGLCAALISLNEYPHYAHQGGNELIVLTILLGLAIGSVSFAGSMVAYAKLNGNLNKDIRLPFYNFMNTGLIIVIFAIIAYMVYTGASMPLMYVLTTVSLLYGVLFVLPIGGADMPVVISLLNSFTGMAAAFGGFLYDNMAMLTGGILVGSAGTILTILMCKAMNRSLTNVIFGAFGAGNAGAQGPKGEKDRSFSETNISDVATMMNYSQKVVIVPGYGLAVAQAQHACHELEVLLEKNGVEVKYAIHPVAGRMPGHMNVLLAESNVSYDKLVEMEEINDEFSSVDVVLVLGANDVVNPVAKTDPSSPIYGMPILNVDEAKTIIINKRSMGVGYAGIDNDLFYLPKSKMLFGDAKKVLNDLVSELKQM